MKGWVVCWDYRRGRPPGTGRASQSLGTWRLLGSRRWPFRKSLQMRRPCPGRPSAPRRPPTASMKRGEGTSPKAGHLSTHFVQHCDSEKVVGRGMPLSGCARVWAGACRCGSREWSVSKAQAVDACSVRMHGGRADKREDGLQSGRMNPKLRHVCAVCASRYLEQVAEALAADPLHLASFKEILLGCRSRTISPARAYKQVRISYRYGHHAQTQQA